MQSLDNNTQAFLALVRAGLWETDVRLSQYDNIDFLQVLKLAEEQSVVGLITAGMERVRGVKIPQVWSLQFIGNTLQVEQRNKAMNEFIAMLFDKMLNAGVNPILVKGQGVAQCYNRPFWRSCGDIDLLLTDYDYIQSKSLLTTLSSSSVIEDKIARHIGYTINNWFVELHGSLHSGLTQRIDKVLDTIKEETFINQNVRKWNNNDVYVNLPGINNDIIFIFCHILQHFFRGGIGLRQICDWCRLMWTFRYEIDKELLETRLRSAGIMTEWNAFTALAVNYLGMPEEAMPFYCNSKKYKRKAYIILLEFLKSGNFGHNKDLGYREKGSFIERKVIAIWRYSSDSIKHAYIFPLDSIRVWWNLMKIGLRTTLGKVE